MQINDGFMCELETRAAAITPDAPLTWCEGDPGASSHYTSGRVFASPVFAIYGHNDASLSSGALAGIIVGVVIVAVLLGTGGTLLARKVPQSRRRKTTEETSQAEMSLDAPPENLTRGDNTQPDAANVAAASENAGRAWGIDKPELSATPAVPSGGHLPYGHTKPELAGSELHSPPTTSPAIPGSPAQSQAPVHIIHTRYIPAFELPTDTNTTCTPELYGAAANTVSPSSTTWYELQDSRPTASEARAENAEGGVCSRCHSSPPVSPLSPSPEPQELGDRLRLDSIPARTITHDTTAPGAMTPYLQFPERYS